MHRARLTLGLALLAACDGGRTPPPTSRSVTSSVPIGTLARAPASAPSVPAHSAPHASGLPSSPASAQASREVADGGGALTLPVPAGSEAARSHVLGRALGLRPPNFDRDALLARPRPAEPGRLYVRSRHAWIYRVPDITTEWIGFLWTGGSVALRDPKPVFGVGCTSFHAIAPEGFVCADQGRVTLDPNDPEYLAVFPYSPHVDSPFLHRYGESRGAPLYRALPTEPEQRGKEPGLLAHLAELAAARVHGVDAGPLLGVVLDPEPDLPIIFPPLRRNIHEAHERLGPRSTVAFSAGVRHRNRDFWLTSDYAFIPKDRVVPYPMSEFHGVDLRMTPWPVAFVRDEGRTAYRRDAKGSLVVGRSLPRLSMIELDSTEETVDGVAYRVARDGSLVATRDIVLPELATQTPWGAPLDGSSNPGQHRPPGGRRTWIEVSILGGWLLAYEDTKPVFATLISPGRGGLPIRGRDPLATSATPLGRFNITGKFTSSTMIAPNDLIHSEVPYAQNFQGPYALHTAYWHDRFGHPMSGGCVNLAPIDGFFMYHFTEPAAKPGWYGQRWLPKQEPSTILLIRP